MNFNTFVQSQKKGPYSFFTFSLSDTNQFRAQIKARISPKIQNKSPFSSNSNFGSNQFYKSYNNQILLQKSKSLELTPKKEISQQISQYIEDRIPNKKQKIQPYQKTIQKNNKNNKNEKEPKSHPIKKIKIQSQIQQNEHRNNKQIIYEDNDESQQKPSPQDIQLENKEEQKAPKRGLTYISKKLSQILRQKKRIKSSQLFKIPFLDEEQDASYDQKQVVKGIRTMFEQKDIENIEKQGQQLKDTKQRRNVRRRIYDSINVMVALGIIKKAKNQYIYLEQKDDTDNEASVIQQEEILNKKRDYLKKLQRDCLYKQKCLEYLTQAHSKLRILRKTNVEYEQKLNSHNENTGTNSLPLSMAPQPKIQFPFILFQNGNKDLTVELTNEAKEIQQTTRRKVNDWTDCIQVSNPTKQNDIELIKISGQNMRVISDVDCINLLSSLEMQQNQEAFQSYQTQILRDYDIITLNKTKKTQDLLSKSFNKAFKQ